MLSNTDKLWTFKNVYFISLKTDSYIWGRNTIDASCHRQGVKYIGTIVAQSLFPLGPRNLKWHDEDGDEKLVWSNKTV